MNRRLMFVSAFVAVLMVSVMAYGQQRQGQGRGRGAMGMMGRGMGTAGLLRSEAVHKELGLSEEQVAKLGELRTAGRPQGGANIREMTEEQRQKFMEERAKAAEEQEKKVAAILNEKQNKRLEELRVQSLGMMAVNDEAVAKKLGITDEQKEKLAQMRTEMMEKMREAMSGGGGGGREAFTKMREESEAATKKILTEEQLAKLEELKGKPFDMTELRGAGRGAGGGGRRGN